MIIEINISDEKVAEFVREFRSIDKNFTHQYRLYQCGEGFEPEEIRQHLAKILQKEGNYDYMPIKEAVTTRLNEMLRTGSETYAHYLAIRKVFDRFNYGLEEDHAADPGTYGNALSGNIKVICSYIEGVYFGPLYNENDIKIQNRANQLTLEFMGWDES